MQNDATKPTELTQEHLKSILSYDPETGLFAYLIRRGRVLVGTIAGGKNDRGYIKICINNKRYAAHRLVILYMVGRWPKDQVDHKDQNKSNNSWDNLRECTQSQNIANQCKRVNSLAPYKGITCDHLSKKYKAQIVKNKKYYFLGYFDCPHKAAILYNQKAIELYGEYAFLNEVPEII